MYSRNSYGLDDIGKILNEYKDSLPNQIKEISTWFRAEESGIFIFLNNEGYKRCQEADLFKWIEEIRGVKPDFISWQIEPVIFEQRSEFFISIPKEFSLATFKFLFTKIAYLAIPGILKNEYSELGKSTVDQKIIDEYFNLFSRINTAYEKILKYPIYFREFYPPTESITINKHEALEHHIHAFLQDLYILREKLITFLNQLKKDIRKVAINEAEVTAYINSCIGMVDRSFVNASGARNRHTHGKTTFLDWNVTKGMSLTTIQNTGFPDDWNKKVAYELFEKKKEESFNTAQTEWIDKAIKINKSVTALVESVFKGNKVLINGIFKDELFDSK